MKLIVFAGSAEARRWIHSGRRQNYEQWIFLKNEYGRDLLPEENEKIKIFAGEKSKEDIEALLPRDSLAIIDGHHPFSYEFSKELKELASNRGIEYLRLVEEEKAPRGVVSVDSYEEASRYLERSKGNILLTMGSQSPKSFMSPRLHLRIYARIEPSLEALQEALELGLGYKQILALQGPFSQEMNLAMIDQYKIKIMVTGESGLQEGVEEKAIAARKAGITLLVIRDPMEKRYSLYEIEKEIEKLAKIYKRQASKS